MSEKEAFLVGLSNRLQVASVQCSVGDDNATHMLEARYLSD